MAATEATQRSPDSVGEANSTRRRARLQGVRSLAGSAQVVVAGLAVAAPLAAFVPLAVQASQKDAFAWDVRVSEAIHAYENRRTILNSEVDVLGVVLRPPVQLLGLLIVIAVLLAMVARGRPRSALFIALGVGGAAVLGLALKGVFERPPVDPSGHGYSFPSGHAMRSMAAASALTVVAWPSRWRWPAALGGMIAAVLTGVAVVYHEWHWVSDVFAGWCVSVAWLGLVWLALRPAK